MRTIIWLKVIKVVDEYWLLLQSLPSLGEWIEIQMMELVMELRNGLSLRWESGLKFITHAIVIYNGKVSPFAGRVD